MPAAATSRSDSVPRPRPCFVFTKSFSEARRRGSLRQKCRKDFSEAVPETSPPLSLITPQSGAFPPILFAAKQPFWGRIEYKRLGAHKMGSITNDTTFWTTFSRTIPCGMSSGSPSGTKTNVFVPYFSSFTRLAQSC